MKKSVILLFFYLLLVMQSKGQDKRINIAFAENPYIQIPSIDNVHARIDLALNEKSVIEWLNVSYPSLFLSGSSIQIQAITESPYTKHYLFQQLFEGIQIYGHYIKVNVEKNGYIINVVNNTSHTEQWNMDLILSGAFEGRGMFAYADANEQQVIYLANDGPHYGKLILLNTNDKSSDTKDYSTSILINKDKVLWTTDLHAYFAHDTIAKAYVFRPDPLSSAGVEYGGAYVDNNDSTNASLNNQRVLVNLPVMDTLDTFYVRNNYCAIIDFAPPFKSVITAMNDSFLFTRYDDAFEDVNAFYHINTIHDYVNDSLGFLLVNYPIMVDPHAAGGADNSFFSYSTTPPSLQFGEGGVDDAEDADVVVHEYGHAISYAAAPLTNLGRERQAIDEGYCDYLATSYSKALFSYHSDSMFTWDGHNVFWPGRVANTTRAYNPFDSTGTYVNGSIWCSALVEIEGKLGREKTNKLAIQTMYLEAANTKMPYAGLMLLKADTILYGGVDYCFIVHSLYTRNLIDNSYAMLCDFTGVETASTNQDAFHVLNEAGFASGKEPLIVWNRQAQHAEINLYSINGELISSMHSNAMMNEVSPSLLSSGFYVLQIRAAHQVLNQKLIKY